MIPKYDRPSTPVPGNWPSGPAYPKMQPQDNIIDATQLRWQDFFIDTKLQRILETALENNRDLQLAALNVERARALYGVQLAKLLPVIDGQAGMVKQRYSSDFVSPGTPNITKAYSVDLGITAWEIDFFGRIRSLSKQALEEYLGTAEARRSVQIALISEVARAYLVIAADQANLNLAWSTLTTQEGVYNLVLRKYNAMLVNDIDLYRAKTQVDTARVDVVSYTQQVAQDKNALNLLSGTPVPEDLLPVSLDSAGPLIDIFPGLSSDVLLRRPDIMSAEYRLKGAYANIGAARAAFFPSISLTTAVGTASSQFSGLFSGGKGTWIFAPQMVLPVFDANVWAAYRVSETDRKIALTRYELVIQRAFKEVADVLAVQGTVDQQIAVQQSMVDSAQKVYRLSGKRYANGIDSYLSVLDAQRSLYSAQQSLISIQLSKLVNEVRAYAVLGGGTEEGEGKQPKRSFLEEKALVSAKHKSGKSRH